MKGLIMTDSQDEVFEETAEVPTGRKTRVISPARWARLEESAKRGIAFAREAAPEVIAELRKDLMSAAVKAKYDVTTSTAVLENGLHRLTFGAVAKHSTGEADGAKVQATKPPAPKGAK
jgi:hypothetical protein